MMTGKNMISINTYLMPFRLKVNGPPVNLEIELVNRNDESSLVSMELLIGQGISLEKDARVHKKVELLGTVNPGERKKFIYKIYPSSFAKQGSQPMQIKAIEHFHEYKYPKREYSKRIELNLEWLLSSRSIAKRSYQPGETGSQLVLYITTHGNNLFPLTK